MKKRALLLVVFMLALFAIPAFHRTTSLTEGPNKAYYTSEDWEEIGNATVGFQTPGWEQVNNASLGFQTPQPPSNYSLSGFEETLPDDVFYYPDGFGGDIQVAVDGDTGEYVKAQLKDSDYVVTGDTTTDELYYSSVCIGVERFDYAIYGFGDGTGTVKYYDGGWQTLETITSEDWYNGSVSPLDPMTLQTERIISFELSATGGHDLYIDYAEIQVYYLSSYTSDSYGESFANISDWVENANCEGDDVLSSNGDVLTLTFDNDNPGGDSDRFELTGNLSVPLSTDLYYETRVYISNTTGLNYLRADFRTGASQNEYLADLHSGIIAGTWITQSGMISRQTKASGGSTFNYLAFRVNTDGDAVDFEFKLDYFRIGPANQTGWQHDMSTLEGITDASGASSSTDGDILTITNDDSSTVVFYLDTTATLAALDLDYYPFFEIAFHSDSNGVDFALQTYNGSYTTFQSRTTIASPYVYRYDLKAFQNEDLQRVRIWGYDNQTTKIDYMKLYSIANYTITQNGTNIDDFLYTEDGTLYSVIDSGEIVLDRDPALNITSPYHSWEMNTTQGTPQISVRVGTWSNYTSDTTGVFPAETLSDLRLKFTDNANMNGIIFGFAEGWVAFPEAHLLFDMVRWESVVSAIVGFVTNLDTTGLEAALIFFGLVLIPASTLFLAWNVKERRDELSVDIFLFFLITFFIGWALLLGGVYG